MAKNLQILIVEDDIDLAKAIIEYFELEGIQCDHASNGVLGLKLSQNNHYDAIILDINLPKMNGLDVCKNLRAKGIDTSVLMLTAKDTLDDKLAGFSIGAGDYLIKPFAMEELIVRVQALARRRCGQVHKLLIEDLDLQQKFVKRASEPLKLSPISFKILESLMRESPQAIYIR